MASTPALRTNVYIDGFNLYYGCLRNTPYKWLNLEALCRIMLPNDQIQRIKYFTAHVSARPYDPTQPARQQVYLRALHTLPKVTIILGQYSEHAVYMPLLAPIGTPRQLPPSTQIAQRPPMVWVLKSEEKGSDVNLATQLLMDACRRDFDIAVVVSNDSDLVEPIKLIQSEYGLPVGVLNPQQQHPSVVLARHAAFIKNIRSRALGNSQFPTTLSDNHGSFHKPPTW
jgi:uncharacterized LabA/DUF88 family protein